MSGRRWTVNDRNGNSIYLTEERWQHIIAPENHPELVDYEMELQETIRSGLRQQDSLNPHKYRYSKSFSDLPADNTHIVAITLFAFTERNDQIESNNYIVTAFMKEIG